MTASDAVYTCEGDHIHMSLNCDAETQWEDPSVSDHNYSSKSQLNLKPPKSDMGTKCNSYFYKPLQCDQTLPAVNKKI